MPVVCDVGKNTTETGDWDGTLYLEIITTSKEKMDASSRKEGDQCNLLPSGWLEP